VGFTRLRVRAGLRISEYREGKFFPVFSAPSGSDMGDGAVYPRARGFPRREENLGPKELNVLRASSFAKHIHKRTHSYDRYHPRNGMWTPYGRGLRPIDRPTDRPTNQPTTHSFHKARYSRESLYICPVIVFLARVYV